MKQDLPIHKGQRKRLCDELKRRQLAGDEVLAAMMKVPRHWFVDSSLEALSYKDMALPIAGDQTISQPSTVAFQTQLLDVKEFMKVLEVGTGSGYQTAVLCAMKAFVYTVERKKELFDRTKRLLWDLKYNAKCFLGDGFNGISEVDYGPYDRIIVTCGATEVPSALVAQLKVGGVMVIPVGNERHTMFRIVKNSAEPGDISISEYGDFLFVPMLHKIEY